MPIDRNTIQRKAVEFKRIEKPYSELNRVERDTLTGCTVCEQDQVPIKLANLQEFRVCKILAEPIRETLVQVLETSNEEIEQIIAYRVGMTRGDIDEQGNRTGFSNHSYGIAIDINSEHNGLYDQCFKFSESCRLIKGGPWRPDTDHLSLREESAIVHSLKAIGLNWGGRIAGKQKDFMHFSPTGY